MLCKIEDLMMSDVHNSHISSTKPLSTASVVSMSLPRMIISSYTTALLNSQI